MFHHHVVGQCLTFLNDVPRNAWYKSLLHQLCPGKIVFEAGCGAGILAAYALESGADHYYGIDIKSDRARFTAEVLDRMGFQGKHTVWCADAANVLASDLPERADVVVCEQTGHQMQSNFTIRQFWQRLRPIYPNAVFVPDAWSMDAYIYHGCQDSTVPEYQPKILLADEFLPRSYAEALNTMDFIKPDLILPRILEINSDDPDQPLEFILDLSKYSSATLVLQDSISFQDNRCHSTSALTDWPVPVRIVIDDAGSRFRFRWDDQERRPGFSRGFWNWQKIS